MKVEIIREGCIACGLCVSICPDVFTIADDGLAEAIEMPEKQHNSAVKEAAESCPVNVIKTEE